MNNVDNVEYIAGQLCDTALMILRVIQLTEGKFKKQRTSLTLKVADAHLSNAFFDLRSMEAHLKYMETPPE